MMPSDVSKKKKKPAAQSSPAPPVRLAPPENPETQVAEALTVLWMLLCVCTLVCEVASLALWLYLKRDPESQAAAWMFFLASFSAVAAGLLSLLVMYAVRRLRRVPPPPRVTTGAIIIAVIPLVVLVGSLLR